METKHNTELQRALEQIILAQRDKLFSKPGKDEGVVVIVSGGLDSTIGLFRLLQDLECTVYPLYIRRGARAESKELRSVEHYLNAFRSTRPQLQALETVETEVPPKQFKQYATPEQLVQVGHTLRNSSLQSIGVQYAASLSSRFNTTVRTIFTFSSPDDNFPHSQMSALRSQTVMTCTHLGDWRWQVTSPLLEPELWGKMTKAAAIEYAIANGLDLSMTYTCISNDDVSCGTCDACEARLAAFKRAGCVDPLPYQSSLT